MNGNDIPVHEIRTNIVVYEIKVYIYLYIKNILVDNFKIAFWFMDFSILSPLGKYFIL